jgi:hypothetical protein
MLGDFFVPTPVANCWVKWKNKRFFGIDVFLADKCVYGLF